MPQWLSYPLFSGPFTGQEQLLASSSTSPGAGMIRIPAYAVASFTGSNIYLPFTGGTLTGPLILAEDPAVPLEAATKNYVDVSIAAIPGAAIVSQTITTVTANTITVPGGTNYIICNDSVHAVNTLTVGSGTLTDGYNLWMTFPNGGVFSGQTLSAHGNLTLKTLGGGWSILSKFG